MRNGTDSLMTGPKRNSIRSGAPDRVSPSLGASPPVVPLTTDHAITLVSCLALLVKGTRGSGQEGTHRAYLGFSKGTEAPARYWLLGAAVTSR